MEAMAMEVPRDYLFTYMYMENTIVMHKTYNFWAGNDSFFIIISLI